MNQNAQKALDWLMTIGGHAITGFATAFFVEVMRIMTSGITDWNLILQGAMIGGALGFVRVIVEELQKLQTSQLAGSTKKVVGTHRKEMKTYFGF